MTRYYGLTAIVLLYLSLIVGAQTAEDPSAAAYRRSYQLETQKKYTEALEALKKVKDKEQRTYFYSVRNAWLLYLCKQYDPSIQWYTRAARMESRAVEPLLGLLLPVSALKKWPDVEKICRLILRRDSKNLKALSHLANAYYMQEDYGKAVRIYQKLQQLYPGDLTIQLGVGWSLVKQGNQKQAAEVFQQILAVSPDNQSAIEGLEAAGVSYVPAGVADEDDASESNTDPNKPPHPPRRPRRPWRPRPRPPGPR